MTAFLDTDVLIDCLRGTPAARAWLEQVASDAFQLGIPDCLIAATALARSARLYTFNLKHFQAIEGLDVHSPYTRS